jgi:hypothetical protein
LFDANVGLGRGNNHDSVLLWFKQYRFYPELVDVWTPQLVSMRALARRLIPREFSIRGMLGMFAFDRVVRASDVIDGYPLRSNSLLGNVFHQQLLPAVAFGFRSWDEMGDTLTAYISDGHGIR